MGISRLNKKALAKASAFFWLGNRDSNPNKQSQSLSCYRYTIPQYQTPKQILSHLRVNIIHTLLRSVNLFSKKFACGLSFLFKLRAADAGAGYPGNYFMQILIFQPRCAIISWQCRCSSMAECQLPKLNTGVRFPSPAPHSRMLVRSGVLLYSDKKTRPDNRTGRFLFYYTRSIRSLSSSLPAFSLNLPSRS